MRYRKENGQWKEVTPIGASKEEVSELRQDLTHIVGGDAWVQRTYNEGEVCIDDNKAWLCIATTTTRPSASDTTHWKQISLKEIYAITDNNNALAKKFYNGKEITLIGIISKNSTFGRCIMSTPISCFPTRYTISSAVINGVGACTDYTNLQSRNGFMFFDSNQMGNYEYKQVTVNLTMYFD